jgi:hypothetical protein
MHLGDNYFYYESRLKPKNNYFSTEDSVSKSVRNILSQTLRESESYYNVFISHSAKDKSIILRIVEIIEEKGFKVYVDWIDDSDTNRDEIASKIKKAISKSQKLLYVHTHNSINSKWTPWEIGCFDSLKGANKISILPLLSDDNKLPNYIGQEYLEQYNTISSNYIDTFLYNQL